MMIGLKAENKYKLTELIMLFIATIPMGILNIWIGWEQNNERLSFEKQNAQSILSIQNKELFIKNAEQGLNSQKLDAEFLRIGFDECKNNDDSSFGKIKSYAEVYYSSAEKRNDMIEKVKRSCIGKGPQDIETSAIKRGSENYQGFGYQYVKEKRFLDAAEAYSQAIKITPVDASLWNQRSYALFRAGKYQDAMNSISIAIKIGSDNVKVRKYMAINAAKILCAQGEVIDGRNYIQQSMNVIPGLMELVEKDTELAGVCNVDFNK